MDCFDRQCKMRCNIDLNTIVKIEWLDACFQDGPVYLDEFKDDCRLISIGLFIRETDNIVSLALEWYARQNTFRRVQHIPKVNIISMKKISFPGE